MSEAYPRRTWNQKKLDYEIETYQPNNAPASGQKTWNQKKLDYEIETCKDYIGCIYSAFPPWNQKKLDYEIETLLPLSDTDDRTWNQKKLDYEIETDQSIDG